MLCFFSLIPSCLHSLLTIPSSLIPSLSSAPPPLSSPFLFPLWEMSCQSFQFILTTYSMACQMKITGYILAHSRPCPCVCSYCMCLFPPPPTANSPLLPAPGYSRRLGSNGPEQNNGCLHGVAESFICLRPERVPLAFRLTRRP